MRSAAPFLALALVAGCPSAKVAPDAGSAVADAGPAPLDAGPDACNGTCGPGQLCASGTCLALSCVAPALAHLPCQQDDGGTGRCCEGACRSDCPTVGTCSPGHDGDTCPRPGSPAIPGSCCGSTCLRLDASDRENCGGCGVRCALSEWCAAGACRAYADCAAGSDGQVCLAADGEGVCCGAACTHGEHDPANCGRCGNACVPGSACLGGACTLPDGGAADCAHLGCDGGAVCSPVSRACVPQACAGEADGRACSFGPQLDGVCCGGACVDLTQDPANCGACGRGSGACVQGIPVPVCVGACGPPDCFTPGTTDGRKIGSCSVASGAAGYCIGDYRCHDLLTDPSNCGGVLVACPAGQTCSGGSCSGAPQGCGLGRLGAWCGDGGACCPGSCGPAGAGC